MKSSKLNPTSYAFIGKKDKKHFHLEEDCPHLNPVSGRMTIAAARSEGRTKCEYCWEKRLEFYGEVNKEEESSNNILIIFGLILIVPIILLLAIF